MTALNRNFTRRQDGVLRIEIAAIVMVLTALAILLIMNANPGPRPDVRQAGEPIPPVVNVHAESLVAPQLQPTAGPD